MSFNRFAGLLLLLVFGFSSCGHQRDWQGSKLTANHKLWNNGDTVLFIGNSITQAGGFHKILYAYYATRFPDKNITFLNRGISGDRAEDVLLRFSEDILPYATAKALLMIGINDIGVHLYPKNPNYFTVRAQSEKMQQFRKNYRQLLDSLLNNGITPHLLSPTPYDEQVANGLPKKFFPNKAMGQQAKFIGQLAVQKEVAFTDLHGGFAKIAQQISTSDSAFTLVGPDRVHPGEIGHLCMAYQILKDQQAPQLVSNIKIIADSDSVLTLKNANLSQASIAEDFIRFTYHPYALPLPLSLFPEHEFLPFNFRETFGKELFQVLGLDSGRYELQMDGKTIGVYSSGQLAEGIDWATLNTPQMQQAEKLLQRINYRHRLENEQLRPLVFVEQRYLKDVTPPKTKTIIDSLLREPQVSHYTKRYLEDYQQKKTVAAQTEKTVERLQAQIHILAQPKSVKVILKKIDKWWDIF